MLWFVIVPLAYAGAVCLMCALFKGAEKIDEAQAMLDSDEACGCGCQDCEELTAKVIDRFRRMREARDDLAVCRAIASLPVQDADR